MRIKIEVDECNPNNEIVIRCNEMTDEVKAIQTALEDLLSQHTQLAFYKDKTAYYFPVNQVLFFETEDHTICAHTATDVYVVKYKLYELESLLPSHFTRVSKSTILNINSIQSVTRHLTSSSLIEFQKTHKKVYVSRHYYKLLQTKLLEKRR